MQFLSLLVTVNILPACFKGLSGPDHCVGSVIFLPPSPSTMPRLLAAPQGVLNAQRPSREEALPRARAWTLPSLRSSRRAPLRSVRAADSSGVNWGHTFSSPDASQTVERCLELFASSNLDGVVEFLPEAVVDRVLERRKNKLITTSFRDLSFSDLLDLSQHGDFCMDAYAQRGLILAPHVAARMLSSLKVGADEFLQRYELRAASGEEMIVTFRMKEEDSLVFIRGVHFKKEWFLGGITGEPATQDLPSEPHPQWGPESVVATQLQAFRDSDLATVYRFASPQSQLLHRPYDRFAAMMGNAVYRPLVGHREAQVLRSVQMSRDKACVIVGVTANVGSDSSIPRRSVYAWTLRLQPRQRGEGRNELHNCWLTEGVQPFTSRLYTV